MAALLDDALAAGCLGLSTNLLGQTILRQMGRIELKGDRMVIAHN